jgi:hypothetical protein
MNGIASCRLHDERNVRMGVTRDEVGEPTAALEFASKDVGWQAIADVGFRLHHGGGGCDMAVFRRKDADHSLTPDCRDLHHVAAFEDRQFRAESSAGEIHVLDHIAWAVKKLFEGERNHVEGATESFDVVGRQRRQQQIRKSG